MSTPPPPPPPPPGHQQPPPPYAAGQPVYPRPLGKRRSAGLVILLSIVTCGIWTIVWAFQNGEELQKFRGDGLGGVAHLFITMFISPVTMFILAGEVEQAYRDMGKEPPVTTMLGLWFLLPIIGNFVWYLQIQDAINNYWTMHGQTNDPSL